MKKAIGFFAAMTLASSAFAADIFVRETKGSDLSQRQATEVTDLVKNAVNNMNEHTLVDSESQADFVLQPSIVSRGSEQLLRIEKEKDGDIIAMSEEPINSVNASNDRAMAVTETAMQEDNYVKQPNNMASSDEALARDYPASDVSPQSTKDEKSTSSASTTKADASDTSTGEVAAPSPRLVNPDRTSFFQIGFGPAFGVSLETDEFMYNINASYNMEFSEKIVGKAFADLNFGSGSEEAQFINLGLGGEYYPTQQLFAKGRPYLAADLGYAFTRTSKNDAGQDQTKDAPALGGGAGFKFQAAGLNMDIIAHYTVLLSQIDNSNPQVFGARFAVNF